MLWNLFLLEGASTFEADEKIYVEMEMKVLENRNHNVHKLHNNTKNGKNK